MAAYHTFAINFWRWKERCRSDKICVWFPVALTFVAYDLKQRCCIRLRSTRGNWNVVSERAQFVLQLTYTFIINSILVITVLIFGVRNAGTELVRSLSWRWQRRWMWGWQWRWWSTMGRECKWHIASKQWRPLVAAAHRWCDVACWSVEWSTRRRTLTNQSINQSINKSIDRSITYVSICLSVYKFTKLPLTESDNNIYTRMKLTQWDRLKQNKTRKYGN